MDFSFDDDQLAIRELAYQIFTDRATDEFLLNFSRTDDTYDEEFAWKSTENSPALDAPAFTLEQRRELLGDRNR